MRAYSAKGGTRAGGGGGGVGNAAIRIKPKFILQLEVLPWLCDSRVLKGLNSQKEPKSCMPAFISKHVLSANCHRYVQPEGTEMREVDRCGMLSALDIGFAFGC